MNRASNFERVPGMITRTIPALVAIAILVLAGLCAMCFSPGHPCCHTAADDYMYFEAAGCIGCQSNSASIVASIDNRKDAVPRAHVDGPSQLLHAISCRHEMSARLLAPRPTVDS